MNFRTRLIINPFLLLFEVFQNVYICVYVYKKYGQDHKYIQQIVRKTNQDER